jgi:hypothetical protein
MNTPENATTHQAPLDDCAWEPDRLDWDTARRLWAIHRDCPPGCRAQLAAGAALSNETEEE